MRPHRRQPTRLLRPWDSPGKNTGVGCHFLLQCLKVKSESDVAQSCPTLSDPMDCSPPGSSVHGIFQARVLEWGATAFSGNMLVQYLKTNQRIKAADQVVGGQWEGVDRSLPFIIQRNVQCFFHFDNTVFPNSLASTPNLKKSFQESVLCSVF